MDVLAHILASALLAYVLYWKWVDHAVSLTYPMHTSGEANEWAEGEDGYYSPVKGWLIVLGVCGAGVALWIFLSPWAASGLYAILSVALLAYIPKNKRTMLRRKAEQFAELERAIQLGPLFQSRPLLGLENGTKRPFHYAYPHFLDIRDYVQGDANDPDEQKRAREVVTGKVRRLAGKDRKYWWRTDRAKDL